MSGREALDRILEQKYPQHYVQDITSVDFFWLIKKIGEDDALPILKLASPEQWQYLLDMELWRKDRIDPEQISTWFERLHKSDPSRLVQWLGSYGQALAYLYMFRNIQVEIKNLDEDEEFPASVRLLYDKNSIFYMPHEQLGDISWFIVGRVMKAL